MNDKIQKIKDDAFNLLSYRERSYNELKERLLKKGYKNDLVKEVMERLKKLNYINDERFTRKWVKDRLKNNPRGSLLIKKELQKKGIKYELSEKIIRDFIDDKTEEKMGILLAKKWIKKHPNSQDKNKYLLKLKRYLGNKGFSKSIIYNIIKSIELD